MPITLITIFFLFSILVTVCPFKIGKFPVDMATGPIIALLALMALGVLDLETVRRGILGNGNLRPWEIIVIFFTTAYTSISVDITGIFDYLAYKIVRKARGNGLKLFVFFYLFAGILTAVASNDIVILVLTPIIFYIGKHSDINVIPLLFAEFFVSNTTSMLLYIGNPTNIIVGNALGLGFVEYTRIMWLPTAVAALASILLLYAVFRKQMTRHYSANTKSRFSVRHWFGAIFSSVMMLIMLGVLAFSQKLDLPIWEVTSIFAGILVIEDIAFGIFFTLKERSLSPAQLRKDKQEIYNLYGIPDRKHEFLIALERVPWKILPFIFACFIFVQGLNKYGVVDLMANIAAGASGTLARGIFTNGVLGLILANLLNNQPMTVLLASVLVSKSFHVSNLIFQGSAYAVIIASNLGANVTLIGGLAGLMWEKILKSKGLEISYLDFLKKGLMVTPIVFGLTLIALYLILV